MEPFTSNHLESRSKEESNKQQISSYTSMNIKMKDITKVIAKQQPLKGTECKPCNTQIYKVRLIGVTMWHCNLSKTIHKNIKQFTIECTYGHVSNQHSHEQQCITAMISKLSESIPMISKGKSNVSLIKKNKQTKPQYNLLQANRAQPNAS